MFKTTDGKAYKVSGLSLTSHLREQYLLGLKEFGVNDLDMLDQVKRFHRLDKLVIKLNKTK